MSPINFLAAVAESASYELLAQRQDDEVEPAVASCRASTRRQTCSSSQAVALAFHSAQCGHLPIVGDNFAASYEYYLPSDGAYWDHAFAIVPFFGPSGYWCTEKEARFGYHHAINPGI